MWKKLLNLKFWIPILLILIGAGITFQMVKNKPSARKKPNFQRGKLVEVLEASLSNPKIEIRTHGRILPAQKIVLSARISGEVIWISPKLSEGRFFKKGDPLLNIGIRQSQSRLKAPFNGVVQKKNIDLGQYVNSGTQLATLIGSDFAEVVIDLPIGRMDWLPNIKVSSSKKLLGEENRYQIPATVSLAGINSFTTWPVMIKRHLLQLTPRGMMVQLIAEAKDPFILNQKQFPKDKKSSKKESFSIKNKGVLSSEFQEIQAEATIPLFVGAFVDVKISGRQLEDVVKIPAKALRDRDTVWVVVNKELQVRNVKIAHIDLDNVYISGGVRIGESIIISPIKGASNGLKVRIAGGEKIGGGNMPNENTKKLIRPEGKRNKRGKKSGDKNTQS